jgi:hypothetical protein
MPAKGCILLLTATDIVKKKNLLENFGRKVTVKYVERVEMPSSRGNT